MPIAHCRRFKYCYRYCSMFKIPIKLPNFWIRVESTRFIRIATQSPFSKFLQPDDITIMHPNCHSWSYKSSAVMWSVCIQSGSINYFYVGLQRMNCSRIARRQQYCNVHWKVKLNVPKIAHCIRNSNTQQCYWGHLWWYLSKSFKFGDSMQPRERKCRDQGCIVWRSINRKLANLILKIAFLLIFRQWSKKTIL